MSVLARMFQRRSGETSNLSNPAGWFVDLMGGGGGTAAGVRVNPASAMRAAAVFACVRVLAETIGALPLHVYRRLPNGGKVRAPEHPLYSLLHDAPNLEMTSAEWRECVQAHLALRGNGYSQVTFGGDGRPEAITPLNPDRLTIRRDRVSKEMLYDYTGDTGPQRTFRFGEILHERSLGGNGIIGYSPIRMAAEAVGVSLAAEEHAARFFSNGANPSGVLQKETGELSPEAYERIRASFAEQYAGLGNSRKPLLLEDGLKWQGISLNHEQAQFLETRKYQNTDIARIFRVPPHMIADLDRATFSNIEQQSIDFVTYCMLPWVVRKEQRYNATLILPSERAQYFCEYSMDGLLRADAASRAAALQIQRRNGVINANEWREIENLNPYDGGDEYVIEQNMQPMSQLGKAPPPAKATREESRMGLLLFPVIKASADRAIRKEIKSLRALAKRPDAAAAIATFYAEHRTYLTEQIGPAYESLGLAFGRDITPQARTLAEGFCTENERLATAAAGDPAMFDTLLNTWEQTRSTQFAERALTTLQLPPIAA